MQLVLEAVLGCLVAALLRFSSHAISVRLARWAARRLPRESRERYLEEWPGVIADSPRDFEALLIAIGFLIAARKIRNSWCRKQREMVRAIEARRQARPFHHACPMMAELSGDYEWGFREDVVMADSFDDYTVARIMSDIASCQPIRSRLERGLKSVMRCSGRKVPRALMQRIVVIRRSRELRGRPSALHSLAATPRSVPQRERRL